MSDVRLGLLRREAGHLEQGVGLAEALDQTALGPGGEEQRAASQQLPLEHASQQSPQGAGLWGHGSARTVQEAILDLKFLKSIQDEQDMAGPPYDMADSLVVQGQVL
jgi:hypothetical protein